MSGFVPGQESVCKQAGPPFATHFGLYGTSEQAGDAQRLLGSIIFGIVKYSDI
jgi:hypothetical protein